MAVIIEGADLAGKPTLADRLATDQHSSRARTQTTPACILDILD